MNKGQVQKLKIAARNAALLAPFAAAGANAQTTGTIDLSPAQATTEAIVGVGVAITIALTVYKLGKRAANRA